MAADHRPCERWCPGLGNGGHWRHHSRFHSYQRRNGTVATIQFDRLCRDCQQIERNKKKNEDRAYAIIRNRAAEHAQEAGKPAEFFMVNMGYHTLVEPMRALMGEKGRCPNCGHAFVGESDIQIDHILPPRHAQDWERLRSGNLRLMCRSCNNSKSDKDFSIWLHEQELSRLANEQAQGNEEPVIKQLSLWN